MYEGWQGGSQLRAESDVLQDPSLHLVVLAGVPSERADAAVAALRAGRNVLSAKPAVTTPAQLEAVRAACRDEARWWVFFSERLCNRAIVRAIQLVHEGAIGRLVGIHGSAPHALAPDMRPDWFFAPPNAGGILSDLATHQADQFIALTGCTAPEIVMAWVDNVATPQHREFCDFGMMSLRATDAEGHRVVSTHHVNWLSPAGLGTWGDVRLVLTGTEGSIEVRSNIDAAGQPGGEHLILVDERETRRVDCSGVAIDWAQRLARDIAEGTDSLMPQQHTLAACAIALLAQERAEAGR